MAGCPDRSIDRGRILVEPPPLLLKEHSVLGRVGQLGNAVENDLIRPKPAAGRPEGRDRGRMRPLARNGRAGDWLRLEPGPPGQGGGAPLEAAIRTREDQDGHEF